jgi:excisionase family DNA binding protein
MSKPTERKFSMAEVARIIGVHPSYVGKLMNRGQFGYYQIGNRRIVSQSHLEQFLLLVERKATVKRFILSESGAGETRSRIAYCRTGITWEER